jgi:membrane protein
MTRVETLSKIKISALLLRDAFREFQQNDPLRMAAATSFFATFALPPILIILIEIFGFFGNPRIIRRDLIEQLSNAIDRNTVSQIRDTLRNVRYLPLNWYTQAAGFIFLLFVATTLFNVIKGSLNQVWKIRLKKGNGIVFMLLYRLKSVGLIIIAGLLFFVVVNGDMKGVLLQEHNHQLQSGVNVFLQKIIYHTISMLAVTAWFILILKTLADARPAWKIAIAGGIFTGILFTIGKIILRFLLSYNKVQTIYGASTSIVLLLLFIFYSSFIFYYGACFTKILALHFNKPILPTKHAMRYALKRVEWDGENISGKVS